MNTDILVEKYVELRDRRAAAKRDWEATDAQFKDLMEKIEGKLQAILDETGASSMRTDHGTFFKTYTTSARVADFDALLSYIQEHDEWGLLERRVSKTRVVELMSERADGTFVNAPPPGVDFTRIVGVQVRRS
jgi:hypothetical protein